MVLYNLLLNKMRQLSEQNGCNEVRTPILWKSELYQTSGHLEHYSKNMFFLQEETDPLVLKPMNCPGHMEIFRAKQWSYRDLPVRFAEYGPLHRNEVSGAIGGLTRCRAFCQDDAHIFVSPETLQQEIKRLLVMVNRVYGIWFKMPYRCTLSTRPDKFLGEVKAWDSAEACLEDALAENDLKFDIAHGEGAFYGPKIDFIVTDSLGRDWQTATIQLDFQLPQRFGCTYTDKDDQEKTPIVIHRAIYGSFERFIGILLEHTQGFLPFWLAPVSACILPINDKVSDYADEIKMKLDAIGVRCEIDKANRTLQQKIAIGYEKKYPYLVILGEKEKTNRTVTLKQGNEQVALPLENFFPKMLELANE